MSKKRRQAGYLMPGMVHVGIIAIIAAIIAINFAHGRTSNGDIQQAVASVQRYYATHHALPAAADIGAPKCSNGIPVILDFNRSVPDRFAAVCGSRVIEGRL